MEGGTENKMGLAWRGRGHGDGGHLVLVEEGRCSPDQAGNASG